MNNIDGRLKKLIKYICDDNLYEIKQCNFTISEIRYKKLPLFITCRYGKIEILKYFMSMKEKLNDYMNDKYLSKNSINYNQKKIIILNVYDIRYNNNECLRTAIYHGHLDIIKFILEYKVRNKNYIARKLEIEDKRLIPSECKYISLIKDKNNVINKILLDSKRFKKRIGEKRYNEIIEYFKENKLFI